jgi:deoxyribodipyrimidine photo-lyase
LSEIVAALDLEFPPLEWIWRVAEGGEVGKKAMAPLDIDHEVFPVESVRGGYYEASTRLGSFIENRLEKYSEGRNDPDNPAVSGLSPWLHFGHISSFRVVKSVLEKSDWTYDLVCIEDTGKGARSGWWGLSESSESFLDQIITWRELGFNFANFRRDHNSLDSIPSWAMKTLNEHRDDERISYTFEEIEGAKTDDEVWNSAQRQLVRTGHMHNYLRMLWGKRILEWSPDPETAADWMIRINDRWALDGRDPNSYTGIFWVLGRHDRAWGPERPIFGKIRYMSSSNTKRKLKLEGYLSRWAEDAPIPKSPPW